MNMKYRDVTMAVIRDNQNRRRLVATFTIWRNKLRANALEHKKGKKFQFTTTILPYQLFCITHLVGVIGIHFKRLQGGSPIGRRASPQAQSQACRLHSPEVAQQNAHQELFPMSYTSFSRTLSRVLLMAGFQTLARVYAFRVPGRVRRISHPGRA